MKQLDYSSPRFAMFAFGPLMPAPALAAASAKTLANL
jgi:hypothetical protein